MLITELKAKETILSLTEGKVFLISHVSTSFLPGHSMATIAQRKKIIKCELVLPRCAWPTALREHRHLRF